MSLDYYNAREKRWVSPRLIFLYYDELLKKYGSKKFNSAIFDKAREARVGAISLLGIHKKSEKKYLLQVPKAINSSDFNCLKSLELICVGK